ncbi:MAG: hypothetical protein JKY81_04400 [Colwellia sp.]|nr:hypothetical protein [Colwellia sp.]
MKKLVWLLLPLMLTACSSTTLKEQLKASAVTATTGIPVGYSEAQCRNMRCDAGQEYVEWRQNNGQLACACNN